MNRTTGTIFWLALLALTVAFFRWADKLPNSPIARLVVGVGLVATGALFAWIGLTQGNVTLGIIFGLLFVVAGFKHLVGK
jgi:apolipoprotein N-acyltransferase